MAGIIALVTLGNDIINNQQLENGYKFCSFILIDTMLLY